MSALVEAVEGICDAHRLAVHRFNILSYDRLVVPIGNVKSQPCHLVHDSVWFSWLDGHGVMRIRVFHRWKVSYLIGVCGGYCNCDYEGAVSARCVSR